MSCPSFINSVCDCLRVCVCACVRACLRACVRWSNVLTEIGEKGVKYVVEKKMIVCVYTGNPLSENLQT